MANALARIREKSSLTVALVHVPADACPNDPDDLIFLECAETAAVDYLVTGNRKHFPDERKTRVVTARQFMGIVADTQSADPFFSRIIYGDWRVFNVRILPRPLLFVPSGSGTNVLSKTFLY
ncbi:MAG: PIN domain-containing protein [Acidobacteriota bacterium]|nr:PIN domain-containing protein [Acidobacteriota bacterium]